MLYLHKLCATVMAGVKTGAKKIRSGMQKMSDTIPALEYLRFQSVSFYLICTLYLGLYKANNKIK